MHEGDFEVGDLRGEVAQAEPLVQVRVAPARVLYRDAAQVGEVRWDAVEVVQEIKDAAGIAGDQVLPEPVVGAHLHAEGERAAALLWEVVQRGVEDVGRSVQEVYKIAHVVGAGYEHVLRGYTAVDARPCFAHEDGAGH